MNIYIACALTHVPRDHFSEYVEFIHNLAESLTSELHHSVKYALINSDPQLATKPFAERAKLCYAWDCKMVEESDLIIAEASFPSTGLGIEIQVASSQNIPIVMCFRESRFTQIEAATYENPDHTHHSLQIGEGYVSLMALGVPSVFRLIKYSDTKIGIASICDVVRVLDNG
jgi:hypothetical protein